MYIRQWNDSDLADFAAAKSLWGSGFAYEQNAVYLRQAMRRGGWVYSDIGGWLAISADYYGEGTHVGLVPLSHQVPGLVMRALPALLDAGISLKFIKHLDPADAQALCATDGFVFEIQQAGSPVSAYLDDLSEDRYPQALLRVGGGRWEENADSTREWLSVLPSGRGMQDFRYQLRRFCRRVPLAGRAIAATSFAAAADCELEEAVVNWVESIRERFMSRGWPLVRNYEGTFATPNLSLIRSVRRYGDACDGWMVAVDGRPSALVVSSDVSSRCAGVYSLFADTRIFNLSYYTLYLAMVSARRKGREWISLGGSEVESLFKFKTVGAGRSGGAVIRSVCEVQVSRRAAKFSG
jgi:hypothetical protein